MSSRKGLCVVLLCVVMGAAAGLILNGIRSVPRTENVLKWRLETPVIYDDFMKKRMEEAQAEKLNFVFWKKRKNIRIENSDYGRQIQADTLGIAGDSSVLFPGANVLMAGESGCCLLSDDVAYTLFGSIDVVGRKIRIGKMTYDIAGIEFDQKNLCIYELSPDEGAKVNFGACSYRDDSEKYMTKRKVMTRVLE